ncbi:MAG TPA: hypothetical protein VF748_12105 [Candidatus Acidoferrum sp.]
MAAKDYTGLRSGRLTALTPHHTNGRKWWWTVRCDCGAERVYRIERIVSGRIKSCGCNQHPRKLGPRPARSPTFRSWVAMLARCKYQKSKCYEGISVCERWYDFGAFLADMGERPSQDYSIDRWPDPAGNYEPGNCRWATWSEQRKNQRKSTF